MAEFQVEKIVDEVVVEVATVVKRIRGDAELARQMRNSTQSLSNNLAEGAGRFGKDRRVFYTFAYGSGRELRAQLRFAVAFAHVRHDELDRLRARLDSALAVLWRLIHPR